MRALLASLFLVSVNSFVVADEFPPIVNTQRPGEHPPTPEEAAAKITVPEGFNVTLFAGEPNVHQPIDMTFDDKGRIWVAECFTYTSRKYDVNHKDRIVILEDTDQDGRFDKRKVFWDKGSALTSVLIGFGGVWVLNNGELAWIPDENRDDVPDGPPVTKLDGFNVQDIGHNIVNGLMWGPDGWIYGRHGITASSKPGTPETPPYDRKEINCSIWRYHPVTQRFEALTHGTTNPWGLDYNDVGEFFFTNNVIGHAWHMIPGAHYKRMFGADFNPHIYELMDQHADHYHWDTGKNWTDSREGKGASDELGGGHSHCGGMIYLGDNWPDEYRGNLFMCNTHGRRVNMNVPVREGSGYVIKRGKDFMFANQPWFRGVNLMYGPDGGVYVSDWTDLGECHDHDGVHRTSGRIYKITYGEPNKVDPNLDLQKLSNKELIDLQRHKNDWYVRHARRILRERQLAGDNFEGVHMVLSNMLKSTLPVPQKLRALWALFVTDGITHDRLLELTKHEDEYIRATSIKLLVDQFELGDHVIPNDKTRDVISISNRFRAMAKEDDSTYVRLCLISALQRIPDRQPSGFRMGTRWELARELVRREDDVDDHNIPLMLWYGIEPASAERNSILPFAFLNDTKIPKLKTFIARRQVNEIANDPKAMQKLVDDAMRLSGKHRIAILQGMVDGLKGMRKVPAPKSWERTLKSLETFKKEPKKENRETVAKLVRELSVVFGDGRATDELKNLVTDKSQSLADRKNALRVLIESKTDDLLPTLFKAATDRGALEVQAIEGLANYNDKKVTDFLLKRYPRVKEAEARDAIIRALTTRPESAGILLDEIEKGKIDANAISAMQARQIASLGDAELTDLLTKVWGNVKKSSEEKHQLIETYKSQLTDELLAKANLSQGRQLFKKTCSNCHKLFGDGGSIGPDITGGNRDNLHYLLENMLDPSAVVAKQYRMTTIILDNGRVLNGIIANKNDKTLKLVLEKEELTINLGDIVEQKQSELSIMPDGMLQKMTDENVRDLIGYLKSRRQVPLPSKN